MTHWIRKYFLLLLLVFVPTFCGIVYYGLIASDVYISESRFIVRSPQRPVSSGLVGQLLQTSGISRSQDDAYAVRDFILSRDALTELNDKLGFRNSFSNSAVDVFNRFPGILATDRSFEKLYKYYDKHVEVEYDAVSSISILTVRAYSAKDAADINNLLLDMSERLINALNERSQKDLLGFADREVKIASDRVKEASLALLEYRSSHSVFEPDRQAALQLEGVAKLEEQLVSTETELAQLRKLSPENPQIKSLNNRIETLKGSIASEASKVTGVRGSFSARAPAFERLALDVEFADKQLGIAIAELETARSEALQKQLYLERLVQANLPDKAMEPRRLRSIFTIFMLSLIGWGVASLLIASIREHGD